MATDAILTLTRLRCIRESDGTGNSEPYIWPVLMWVDDNTLATSSLVGVAAPILGNARVVIKNDMRAGETADIPASVGVRRIRFEDGLTIRQLLLAVALWENDETPEDALHAGFQAFSSELRAAVADNLFAFSGANEEEQAALIAKVEARVGNSVRTAIENGLTGWQKARVLLGTLNLDDIIGGDFKYFPDLLATQITLGFELGLSDRYEIEGELQTHPVPVELCQAQVDTVNAAQSVVKGIDLQIKDLQNELQHASPAEKPFIISQIGKLRREELPDAMAALEAARTALKACRDLNAGNKLEVDEMEIQGFKTKTFFDKDSENVVVSMASDGISTIVAVPKTAISRLNQMGDEEYKCLKACKDIPDLEQRLNCILLCPVTKLYDVHIF